MENVIDDFRRINNCSNTRMEEKYAVSCLNYYVIVTKYYPKHGEASAQRKYYQHVAD